MGRSLIKARKKLAYSRCAHYRCGVNKHTGSCQSANAKAGLLWHSIAARCQGSSHFENSQPCQDQTYCKLFDNGVYVVALADGAGSAKFSHYGAYLAVSKAAEIIAAKFNEAFQEKTAESFSENLVSYLQRQLIGLSKIGINLDEIERAAYNKPSRDTQLLVPCDTRELSSTLLLVAINNGRYLAAHLGDGVIGIECCTTNRKRAIKTLSKPDNGEFSNVTVFTTSAMAKNFMRIYTGQLDNPCSHVTGFILMSDGPEHALYRKSTNTLAPACSKLIQACRNFKKDSAEEKLESTLRNVIAKKTSDDCSIAILAR